MAALSLLGAATLVLSLGVPAESVSLLKSQRQLAGKAKVRGGYIPSSTWSNSDICYENGMPKKGVNYTDKDLFMLSNVAQRAFGLEFKLFPMETTYISKERGRPSLSAPMPGPFTPGPYSEWGGQRAKDGIGADKYTAYFTYLSHRHILHMVSRARLMKGARQADDSTQRKQMKQAIEGSQMTLAWFAQLMTDEEKPSFLDPAPNRCANRKDHLRDLFGQMIFGRTGNFIKHDGSLDVKGIINTFKLLTTDYCEYHKNCDSLHGILHGWEAQLRDLLSYDGKTGESEIAFLPWNLLSEKHEDETADLFTNLRMYYADEKRERRSMAETRRLNQQVTRNFKNGKQLAAFFSSLYFMTHYLDKFFPVSMVSGPESTPPVKMKPGKHFSEMMNKYWLETKVFSMDWFKCVNRGSQEKSKRCDYELLSALLDSSTTLGSWLGGYLFKQMDAVMRGKGSLKSFDTLESFMPYYQGLTRLPGCTASSAELQGQVF
jgi:hypothetical protein